MVCRVGEASHPGPVDIQWKLGLMNPTGLQGKEMLLNSVGSSIFGVTETHLSTHGIQKVRRSLNFARSPFTGFIHGQPARLTAHSQMAGKRPLDEFSRPSINYHITFPVQCGPPLESRSQASVSKTFGCKVA